MAPTRKRSAVQHDYSQRLEPATQELFPQTAWNIDRVACDCPPSIVFEGRNRAPPLRGIPSLKMVNSEWSPTKWHDTHALKFPRGVAPLTNLLLKAGVAQNTKTQGCAGAGVRVWFHSPHFGTCCFEPQPFGFCWPLI